MISATKIFHFETAHAIDGYNGECKNIHGHSYSLHVTVAHDNKSGNDSIPKTGFVIDFKVLKGIVSELINQSFDHKLILSKQFLASHPELNSYTNVKTWEFEPSVENMVIFISRNLKAMLPRNIRLIRLKLFETKDSFAEWES